MRATIILPVKPFDQAKTRLAPLLPPLQRTTLARRFFRHTLSVATSLDGIARCMVVSRSAEVLDLARQAGACAVRETGTGLNIAIHEGMTLARPDRGVLALSSDLPLLTCDDIVAMLSLGSYGVRIAVDRAGEGTNALFMARPMLIRPRFGTGSHDAHRGSATQAGVRCGVVSRPGLATDIDVPADLMALATVKTPWLGDEAPTGADTWGASYAVREARSIVTS